MTSGRRSVPVTAMQLVAGAVVLGGMAVSGRARASGADDSVVLAGRPCCVT